MYRIVLEQTMRSENLTAKLLVDEFNANCKFFNDSVKDFPTQELVMIQYCNMKIINQLLGHIFMK